VSKDFNMDTFTNMIVERLNSKESSSDECQESNYELCKKIHITPSQAVIIAAILLGVLDVGGIFIFKNQLVQIILEGSLKEQTDVDKKMNEISSIPFGDVIKAMKG